MPAGGSASAEEALSKAADEHGDYAVAEVLSTLPPQVTALHLAGFDGAKTSLATLLVPPKAWAESLAYMAATWPDDMIEDDPERIAEGLFNHVHGIVYASDDEDRRHELLAEASATDHGATVFAILWSLGLLGWLDFRLNMFLNVMTPLIMVISFADSMQLTFAARDRLIAGESKYDAFKHALLVVGPACALTHGTAGLSFAALLFADSDLIKTFGLAGLLATVIAFIAVMTLVPPLDGSRLLIYGRKSCRLGDFVQGGGALLCPKSKLKVQLNVQWAGSLLSGNGYVQLGTGSVLTHVPLLFTK